MKTCIKICEMNASQSPWYIFNNLSRVCEYVGPWISRERLRLVEVGHKKATHVQPQAWNIGRILCIVTPYSMYADNKKAHQR